jgi:hypothetical protein
VKNLHDSGAGSLREAVKYANANAGTTIKFAACQPSTIKLTGGELAITQSTTIDGPGADILTVSGTSRSRVFTISSGITVTISGLTITRGLADNIASGYYGLGGGILNQGDLTLKDIVVSDNQAAGAANVTIKVNRYPLTGAGAGGGVANLGTLTVSHSRFVGNEARGASKSSGAGGSPIPGVAVGGGIANVGMATATVTNCWFTGNLAQAGDSCTDPAGIAGDAGGGAIASFAFSPPSPPSPPNPPSPALAKLDVSYSHFVNNRAIGGNENQSPLLPGHSLGGAVASHRFNGSAELKVSHCTFDQNKSIGGNHNVVTAAIKGELRCIPNAAVAGGVFACGKGTISDSQFVDNRAIGGQGVAGSAGIPITTDGGAARGGGINVAFKDTNVTVSHCVVKDNRAIGGQAGRGGRGGDAWGGGVCDGQPKATLMITGSSSIDNNQAQGGGADTSGPPSHGGDGLGGGVYNVLDSTTTVTASPITHNWAKDGKGKNGGSDGKGIGGGVYNLGALTVNPAKVINNHASTNHNNIYP